MRSWGGFPPSFRRARQLYHNKPWLEIWVVVPHPRPCSCTEFHSRSNSSDCCTNIHTHSHTNVIYLQNVARSCSRQIDKWLTGDWQVIDSWSKLLLHANRIKIKDVWKKTAKHQISGGVKRLAKHQNLTMYHPLFFVIQRKYLVNQFPLQPPTKLFFKQKCHCYCSPVPSTDTRWQHLKNNNNIFA